MTSADIDRIWRLAYFAFPNDMQARLDYFEMRVRQELRK